MTRLSVNINKVALLRNSRNGNRPNLVQVARDCESFGAQGITVHPRPDERHVRKSDIPELVEAVTTEFNIEGYPSQDFIDLVLKAKPAQVTLVPDAPGQLTSDHGWDAIKEGSRLRELSETFRAAGIRLSLFLDPDSKQVEAAARTGTDRIEFYTGPYAENFVDNPEAAVAPYVHAGAIARSLGLGINAGHDLDLENLQYFCREVPDVLEVSIGHALIADALYSGLQNTIQLYLKQLQPAGM